MVSISHWGLFERPLRRSFSRELFELEWQVHVVEPTLRYYAWVRAGRPGGQ